MDGTWYFHNLLIVGSLKDCLKAEEIRRSEECDLLLTTLRRAPTSLKETTGGAIAMGWNHFFPEGSAGDEVMRQLPFALWESILPHVPILSTGQGSISLADAIMRIRNVCTQEEDFTSSLQGILLQEWKGNKFDVVFNPPNLISTMSEDTFLVYHRSSDWGHFNDQIQIWKGQKQMILENLEDGNVAGWHDGKMPLVDSFLPEELRQFRDLFRPPLAFTFYHSNGDKLPPGYQWVASSRFSKDQGGRIDTHAIEHLKKMLQ